MKQNPSMKDNKVALNYMKEEGVVSRKDFKTADKKLENITANMRRFKADWKTIKYEKFEDAESFIETIRSEIRSQGPVLSMYFIYDDFDWEGTKKYLIHSETDEHDEVLSHMIVVTGSPHPYWWYKN